jgi:hypothetical protein
LFAYIGLLIFKPRETWFQNAQAANASFYSGEIQVEVLRAEDSRISRQVRREEPNFQVEVERAR